jgi:hypothetical protein
MSSTKSIEVPSLVELLAAVPVKPLTLSTIIPSSSQFMPNQAQSQREQLRACINSALAICQEDLDDIDFDEDDLDLDFLNVRGSTPFFYSQQGPRQ